MANTLLILIACYTILSVVSKVFSELVPPLVPKSGLAHGLSHLLQKCTPGLLATYSHIHIQIILPRELSEPL